MTIKYPKDHIKYVTKCEYCKQSVSGHKKCGICDILVHPPNSKFNDRYGIQNGVQYGHFCRSCVIIYGIENPFTKSSVKLERKKLNIKYGD